MIFMLTATFPFSSIVFDMIQMALKVFLGTVYPPFLASLQRFSSSCLDLTFAPEYRLSTFIEGSCFSHFLLLSAGLPNILFKPVCFHHLAGPELH
jgi:hypothetical protein